MISRNGLAVPQCRRTQRASLAFLGVIIVNSELWLMNARHQQVVGSVRFARTELGAPVVYPLCFWTGHPNARTKRLRFAALYEQSVDFIVRLERSCFLSDVRIVNVHSFQNLLFHNHDLKPPKGITMSISVLCQTFCLRPSVIIFLIVGIN